MSKLFKAAVFSSENNQQVLEHRRFRMDTEACNFLLLQEKLRNLFDNQSVQIFWTDTEGDKVSIKTEADFANCLEEIRAYYAGIIKGLLAIGLASIKGKCLSVHR